MRITSCSLALLITFGFQLEVFADDAKTLPKGRFRAQLVTGFSLIENEFNSTGSSVSMGSAYSQNINTNFLSVMKPDSAKQIQQLRSVLPNLSEDLEIARLGLEVNANVLTNVFSLEYGVTDRLSIGIMVPLVYGQTTVKASSEPTEEFNELMNSSPAPLKAALSNLQEQTSLANINRLLTSELQYDAGLESWDGSGLGDIELGLKYNYFKSHPLRLTFKSGIRLPTGKEDDPNQLFDMGFGDSQLDVGAYHYLDYTVSSNFYLTLETGYIAQLSHRQDYRVPMVEGVSVSPVLAKLDRNPGDYIESGVEANYQALKVINIAAKYRLFHKFSDEFSSPNQVDVRLLEKDTNQQLHQAQVRLGYSNLSRVRSGKDRFPFEVTAFYYHPIAGENTRQTQTGGLQLKSYF